MKASQSWQAGTSLPEINKQVTQEDINLYARAAKDFNPIHIDPEFARKTPLGGTVAHGMLVLAYISQMMTEGFGFNWLTAGSLSVRFKAPARPGDRLRILGKVEKVDSLDGRTLVTSGVSCLNQAGEIVVTGEAKVRLTE
jgi:3-hydroxybutyryl-CoA dehydratase